MKARLSWITLREFLFTNDNNRKKLFWFIISLIRSHRISIDKGLGFMLSMLGYHRHVLEHKRNMNEYRKIVMEMDSGPWKEGLRV
jgi:hypothetical protein